MDPRKINEDLTVSPQITLTDVAQIAALGYKSLICNRPDDEDPGQLSFDEVAAAAKSAGLEVRHQPVASGMVLDEDGSAFQDLMAELPKPVFAYCRSGTRCTILWSLSQSGQKPVNEILEAAGRAGYNMAGIAHRLEE
ncbi:TIGR01244 family sulfur transferase [Roseibium sp.]|uniref:TIGR01244 family sulfur transferase n=1 Tax=Roseibium sp. TaxID=1936156 RepID=UPI003A97EBC7